MLSQSRTILKACAGTVLAASRICTVECCVPAAQGRLFQVVRALQSISGSYVGQSSSTTATTIITTTSSSSNSTAAALSCNGVSTAPSHARHISRMSGCTAANRFGTRQPNMGGSSTRSLWRSATAALAGLSAYTFALPLALADEQPQAVPTSTAPNPQDMNQQAAAQQPEAQPTEKQGQKVDDLTRKLKELSNDLKDALPDLPKLPDMPKLPDLPDLPDLPRLGKKFQPAVQPAEYWFQGSILDALDVDGLLDADLAGRIHTASIQKGRVFDEEYISNFNHLLFVPFVEGLKHSPALQKLLYANARQFPHLYAMVHDGAPIRKVGCKWVAYDLETHEYHISFGALAELPHFAELVQSVGDEQLSLQFAQLWEAHGAKQAAAGWGWNSGAWLGAVTGAVTGLPAMWKAGLWPKGLWTGDGQVTEAGETAIAFTTTGLILGGLIGALQRAWGHRGNHHSHAPDSMQVVRKQKQLAAAGAYHTIVNRENASRVIASVLCASAMYYIWSIDFSRLW